MVGRIAVRAGTLASSLAVLVCGPLVSAQESDELLQRGTYLMESIAACGNCHTPKRSDGTPIENLHLAGSFVIEEPALKAYAPNITMDEATGIGSWSDDEIIRAISRGRSTRWDHYRSADADALVPRYFGYGCARDRGLPAQR